MPNDVNALEPEETLRRNRKAVAIVGQMVAIVVLSALLGLGFNRLRPHGLPLMEDWSPNAQLVSPGTGEDLSISLGEAETLFFAQGAVFLDARSEEQFRQGHIQGARNLPWSEFEARFPQVMGDVPTDAIVITYCDGESCNLSKEVAFALIDNGYTRVRVLVNGWSTWNQATLPTEN